MGTREIASKQIGQFNIDNDQVYIVDKNNFGWTSDDDVISTATNTDVGGIKLYTDIEAPNGVISDVTKKYALQIENNANPKAFVHVPWYNSQYMAWDPTLKKEENYDIRLCVDSDSTVKFGDNLISTLGYFYIDHIDAGKISARNHHENGDGDNALLSTTEELSNYISDPLRQEASAAHKSINKAIETLEKNHLQDIYNLSNNISSLSNETFNTINNISTYLSDEINNLSIDTFTRIDVLCSNQDIAPSWFKDKTYRNDQIDELLNQLSNTVNGKFMEKYESYLCSETSSVQELNDMFSTKQDNLSVRTVVKESLSDITDIPTVAAVMKYVNSSLTQDAATFRGSYDSLADVPTDGTRYVGGKPDQNDYMFVDITDDTTGAWRDSLKSLAKGTWRFKYVCKNHIVGDDPCSCWDKTGIGGWYEEYLINDAMFTNAQKEALNSGITQYLVSLIMSYPTLKAKLIADYPNMNATLGSLAYKNEITDNIIGKGSVGKLAVFDGTNHIKSNDSIAPKIETWQFTLIDGSTVTKKVVVSD